MDFTEKEMYEIYHAVVNLAEQQHTMQSSIPLIRKIADYIQKNFGE